MIEKAAAKGKLGHFDLPVPLLGKRNCSFSYSGLKTSLRYTVEKLGDPKDLSDEIISNICASFQNVALRHVSDRLRHAYTYVCKKKIPITAVTVVGGVACNQELRR
jgi:N6-L-threonylcarbamoyladenine synthase